MQTCISSKNDANPYVKPMLFVVVCILLGAAPLSAQDPEGIAELGKLQPAEEMTPALKYSFQTSKKERVYQNAAYHYQRAMRGLRDFDRQNQDFAYPWERDWLSQDASEWPIADVETMLAATERVFRDVEAGSRCHVCDWNFHPTGKDSLSEIISMELDEIQETRRIARYLQIKSRYEIFKGDFDSAATTLRCMFQLSRDCLDSPWIVSGLVGGAIHGIANGVVEDWIAAEDSPNLYWALTSLGDHPIDLGQCIVGEVELLYGSIKAFDNPESREWTSDEWVSSLATDLGFMIFNRPGNSAPRPTDRMMVSGMMLSAYPIAKRELAKQGYDKAELEKMPVGQVVCIHQSQQLEAVLQNIVRWTYVKSPEGYARFFENAKKAEQGFASAKGNSFLTLTLATLLPGYSSIGQAELRINRHNAGLKTVEAIRMHLAETGSVPESLDEIECVAIPADPFTGQPFEYRVDRSSVSVMVPGESRGAARVYRFQR